MTTIIHNSQPKVELDSELGASEYSKQATCSGWSGGYHSNICCEGAGDGGGTCDFFFEIGAGRHRDDTLPASHVLGRCGRKMRTLNIYSPGTRKCGYFYVIHCIHASAFD